MKLLKQLVTGLLLLLGTLLLPSSAYAAANTITVTGPTTVASDATTVAVTVNADLGTASIPVVDAYIVFDPSAFEFVGINYGGSPFTADTIDAAQGANFIKISRYASTQPYPTGAALLGKITFRPKISTGTTQISVDKPQSGFFDELGNDTLVATVPLSITFTAPPTAVAPTVVTQPTNTTTPTTPTSTPSSTAPKTNPTTPTTQTPSTTTQTSATPEAPVAPAAQPEGTVEFKQKTYTNNKGVATNFLAKTPVRISLFVVLAMCAVVAMYVTYKRTQRYAVAKSRDFDTSYNAANPTAQGIKVSYGPTVIEPNLQKPSGDEDANK